MTPRLASSNRCFGRPTVYLAISITFLMFWAGCAPAETEDSCELINCSGHGSCVDQSGSPVCICADGYHAQGLDCLANDVADPCLGVTCSDHGHCTIVANTPSCVCDEGYEAQALNCIEIWLDPCAGETCSHHGSCQIESEAAVCLCDEGYHAQDLTCLVDDLPSVSRPIWFLHISDTHFGGSSSVAEDLATFLSEVVPVVEPVATVNTGDTTESGTLSYWQDYRAVIDPIASPYPQYQEIPGNHDIREETIDNFNNYSQTGLAGGGLHGQSFAESSQGLVRIVRTNTADSDSSSSRLAGIFSEEQMNELLALPDPDQPVHAAIVLGHHPIFGFQRLPFGYDFMRSTIDHFGASVYFCGHTHIVGLGWLDTTLAVRIPSFGKSNPPMFSLLSLDESGPALRQIAMAPETPWPLVLITGPADTKLGLNNPHAVEFTAGSQIEVRAIGFSPSGVDGAEMRINDEPWTAMEFQDQHFWTGRLLLPDLTGEQTLEVRANSAEGSESDSLTLDTI